MVLEGADGSGKSTQAGRLAGALRELGHEPLHLREPGSTKLGERVRDLLLDPEVGQVSAAAETLLYMAARAQLVEEVVRPALGAGRVVVCERWVLSTEVYQGLAGGFGAEEVRALAERVCGGVTPDLVVVLDVELPEARRRQGPERDRMESKDDEFHRAVVEGYRRLASGRPGHVVVPPGDPDRVAERVLAEVGKLVG